MAQAPQGGGGAPRQNKTVKEFKGMNTQNRRNAIPEGSFAWLENIQPIGPGHLHSIPGRSASVVRIPPLIPPVLCTDSTLRGQAPVTIENRFDQFSSFPPNTNLRTSWGYITPAEEVWASVGEAGCDGGNMGYHSTCVQLNHWQSHVIVTHPALIDPNPFLPFIGQAVGVSDVPIYGAPLGNQWNLYFPNDSTHLVYNIISGARGLIVQTGENLFCKIGDKIYFPCHASVSPNEKHIVSFTVAGAVQTDDIDFVVPFDISHIAATSTHLYVMGNPLSDANLRQIRKYNRTTLALDDTFMLDNIAPFAMGLVSNNLIYVLCEGLSAGFYYIENFTDLVYVGNTGAQDFTPFGNVTGMFVNGSLYYGANALAGFSPDIFKISIACPEGSPATPVIASVTRGSASVAAGANIVVSWADVLLPVANDRIWLLPAPTPPNLGIIAPPVVSRITDGLGTSSMNFLIPMGTTPGTYILAFMANDRIYVAKTATFTVT